jgi:hypothetical protein
MQLLNVNMFLLLVFFATALVSLVTGNPITERTLSYDTDNDTEATFIVTHEGQDYELKGTVQKVIAQMDVLHPGYAANITARVNEDLENHAAIQVELQPRNQVFPPLCIPVTGQDWAGCPYYPDSFNAISTLYRFNQPIHAYPSSCSMISCSGSCGIYLCNDVKPLTDALSISKKHSAELIFF